jgi:hypothetical protein
MKLCAFAGEIADGLVVLYVCFVGHCLSFCTFLLAIVLSVLRYTDFDYPLCYLQTPLRYENPSNQIINISVFSHPSMPYALVFEQGQK